MTAIAGKTTSINIIVHYPKTEEGKRELAKRVSGVHADTVNQYIKNLTCPSEQKEKLLDAVIDTAKQKNIDKSNADV